jgi:hypothetical protein
VLALIGNLLHPRYDGEDIDIYRSIASSDRFRVADFVLLAALLLIVAGLTTFARSLHASGDALLSEYGRLATLAGGTIAIAQFGVETYGLKQQATVFAGAGDADLLGAFWATNGVDRLNTALFNTWTIVLLGLAPLLLGIAVLRIRRFPKWFGVLGAIGGTMCLVVGCMNLAREDQTSMQTPFLIGSLLVTAWLFCAGASMMRLREETVDVSVSAALR